MAAPYDTMLLDVGTWDLCLDANGNYAVATYPYALAQDVASACRTVLGEVYYDTTLGVDYFGQLFGKTPPTAVFSELFIAAALTVPGVDAATCVISSFDLAARTVTGQVQFTDINGNSQTVAIS
jgi:hypothetical protein